VHAEAPGERSLLDVRRGMIVLYTRCPTPSIRVTEEKTPASNMRTATIVLSEVTASHLDDLERANNDGGLWDIYKYTSDDLRSL
jgi:hypothetical protein